jgi:hypothetical protein
VAEVRSVAAHTPRAQLGGDHGGAQRRRIYYASFTIILLCCAALAGLLLARSRRALIHGVTAAALIVGMLAVNISPTLAYRVAHGTDSGAFLRTPAQSKHLTDDAYAPFFPAAGCAPGALRTAARVRARARTS